jgi:hypothetical protein
MLMFVSYGISIGQARYADVVAALATLPFPRVNPDATVKEYEDPSVLADANAGTTLQAVIVTPDRTV